MQKDSSTMVCLHKYTSFSFLQLFVLILTILLSYPTENFADTKVPIDRALQNIKYQQDSLEHDVSKLDQKIQNQELVLESIRDEVTSLLQACKESQKSFSTTQETKLKAMEKNIEKLISDLKQFKTHANETSSYQATLQKKIQDMNEVVMLQGQQIQDLESAIRSLALAMQGKTSSESSYEKKGQAAPLTKDKTYRVKSGDTLEKIAKDQCVSIQAIKDRNNLANDKIVIGQELKIP